jgi:lipoprotein-anchoring transpeptidase ErfK/SrfK
MKNYRSIIVEIKSQTATLYEGNNILRTFSVSTAKLGTGNHKDRDTTPLGLHFIAQKIGAGMPVNTQFKGRKPLPELYNDSMGTIGDFILTRILWLSGAEPHKNYGGDCDTKSRYIYFHGTPDGNPMGVPLSHGCIRMRNSDILWFFDAVSEGTAVNIIA